MQTWLWKPTENCPVVDFEDLLEPKSFARFIQRRLSYPKKKPRFLLNQAARDVLLLIITI